MVFLKINRCYSTHCTPLKTPLFITVCTGKDRKIQVDIRFDRQINWNHSAQSSICLSYGTDINFYLLDFDTFSALAPPQIQQIVS